jgi:hypothetical protein
MFTIPSSSFQPSCVNANAVRQRTAAARGGGCFSAHNRLNNAGRKTKRLPKSVAEGVRGLSSHPGVSSALTAPAGGARRSSRAARVSVRASAKDDADSIVRVERGFAANPHFTRHPPPKDKSLSPPTKRQKGFPSLFISLSLSTKPPPILRDRYHDHILAVLHQQHHHTEAVFPNPTPRSTPCPPWCRSPSPAPRRRSSSASWGSPSSPSCSSPSSAPR